MGRAGGLQGNHLQHPGNLSNCQTILLEGLPHPHATPTKSHGPCRRLQDVWWPGSAAEAQQRGLLQQTADGRVAVASLDGCVHMVLHAHGRRFAVCYPLLVADSSSSVDGRFEYVWHTQVRVRVLMWACGMGLGPAGTLGVCVQGVSRRSRQESRQGVSGLGTGGGKQGRSGHKLGGGRIITGYPRYPGYSRHARPRRVVVHCFEPVGANIEGSKRGGGGWGRGARGQLVVVC